jgi:hypothetical protein
MNDSEIIVRVTSSLNDLFAVDAYLLTENLSERCITHKLAEHLQRRFENYHVDCEYNGNSGSQAQKRKSKS